jgi:subtilisin family serine protease
MADGSVRFVGDDVTLAAWQATATIAGDDDVEGAAGREPAGRQPSPIRDHYIVLLAGAGNTAATAAQIARENPGLEVVYVYDSINGFAARIPQDRVAVVAARPGVRGLEQDQVIGHARQTNPRNIGRVGGYHNRARAGTGHGRVPPVTLAIVDSGVDATHPDLNVVGARAFGPFAPDTRDLDGHGTHVAGIAAARDNNIGVVGMAPGAHILNYRVLDATGSGSVTDVIAAVNDIIARGRSRIQVVNMSLGAPTSPSLNLAVERAVAAGIVVVAAAGNSRQDVATESPASAPSALTVAALDTSGPHAADHFATQFSNFGAGVDFLAPGVNILSTIPVAQGSYGIKTGTSMSAPHVAGLAALLKAYHPNFTPRDVRNTINDYARHPPNGFRHAFPGPAGPSPTGPLRVYHLINAAERVSLPPPSNGNPHH